MYSIGCDCAVDGASRTPLYDICGEMGMGTMGGGSIGIEARAAICFAASMSVGFWLYLSAKPRDARKFF